MKRAYIVTVEIPEGSTPEEVGQYIDEAICVWCKSFDPMNDPLFDLDGTTVKVRLATRSKKAEGVS
jgi:hypothetical protein